MNHISTLLLCIMIFQHFGQLNAMETGEGSSLAERRKIDEPQGPPSRGIPKRARSQTAVKRPNQDQHRVADPDDGPPHKIIYYGNIEIEVWLDGLSRVRKAIYPENYIPQASYFKDYNLLIRILEQDDLRLVAYFNELDRLLGVRPRDPTGKLYKLEPTGSVWYIIYAATYFRITVKNSAPLGISLMPKNIHVPEEHSAELKTVAGITFRLFRGGRNSRITGAELIA